MSDNGQLLSIVGVATGIVSLVTGWAMRSVKQTIQADVSAPIAILQTQHTALDEKLDAYRQDQGERERAKAMTLEDIRRDTHGISERVTRLEERTSGGFPRMQGKG